MFRLSGMFSKAAPAVAKSIASQADKASGAGFSSTARMLSGALRPSSVKRTDEAFGDYSEVSASGSSALKFGVIHRIPHEQENISKHGFIGNQAMQFLKDGQHLDVHSAMAFLQDRELGLAGLQQRNPVVFELVARLSQLVATLAPAQGIAFNPKPHSFDLQNRPSGSRFGI